MAEREDAEPTTGDERTVDDRGEAEYEYDREPDEGGPYLDEEGYNEDHAREDPGNPLWDETLIALLLVGGVVLLLFPEPATSGLGAVLIALGVLAWVIDAIG